MSSGSVVTRKFFQIGFNKCGTTFFEQLFQMNGIPALHWLKGALADDIAYSRLTGRAPLAPWSADTVAFTDMESVRHINMPVIEAFKEYAYLDQHFPGAVFVLNTRRVEDWINSRYLHLGGRYARASARILDVGLADLADIWRTDWQTHIAGCRAHFGDRPEFVEIDIDEAGPQDYRDALAPWFDLPLVPDLPDGARLTRRSNYQQVRDAMLSAPQPGDGITPQRREAVAAGLARFASPARISVMPEGDAPLPEGVIRLDAATGELRDPDGNAVPIRRDGAGRYIADPREPGWLLTAAAANDIGGVTDHGSYLLDMRDACRIGTGGRFRSPMPVIAPSRREGAENVFLWPMPRFHRLSNEAFIGLDPNRVTPLADRQDRAIWAGGLDGYAIGTNGPELGRPAGNAVQRILSAPPGSPRGEAARQDLRDNARIAFLAAHQDHADIDLFFTPDPRATQALRRAGLDRLITTRPSADPLHSHRYVICLGGAPLSEQLLPALNAGAVALKEEDGWQLYHSGVTRPWEHYIPLDYGAGDLAEKLQWARDNPAACARISRNARSLCAALADPAGRARHLSLVLAAYRAATGQED